MASQARLLRAVKERTSELAESQARYRQLFDAGPDALFLLDPQGHILEANAAAVERYGYSHEELLSMVVKDLVAPELREQAPTRAQQAIADGFAQFEWRHRRKDGSELPVEVNARTVEMGGERRIFSSVRDITERKRLEEALRESEERFAKVFRSSPDSITLTSLATGLIVEANESASRLTGYSRDELIGKSTTELDVWADPADRDRYVALLRKQGRVLNLEASFRIKSGETRDALVSGEVIELHDGRYILGVIRDITERKRAEEALRASEKRLSLIFDTVGDVIFLLAVEPEDCFRFISVNPAFLAVTGLTQEQVVGKRMEEVLPETAHALVLGKYKEAIRENKTVRWEEVSAYPTGTLYGEVAVTPAWDAAGVCTHLIGSVHDITGIRRAEEVLRESEERYRSLFTSSLDAVLLTTPDGRILAANPAACEMFGRTEEELKRVGRSGVVDVTDPHLAVALEERARTGKSRAELTYIRKDGSKFTGEVSSVVFTDREGQLRTSMVIRDITERKRATEVIQRQLAMLHALYAGARDLVESLDLQEIAENAVHTCVQTLGAKLAWLGRAEEDGSVRILTQFPPDNPYLGQLNVRWDDSPLGQGPTGRAIRNGSPVIGADLRDLPGFAPWREAALAAGLLSSAAFPLISRGRPFGALNLYSDQVGFFTPERVELFQAFADQAAAALENARLFAEVQRHTAELEERVAERTAALQAANEEMEAFSYSISHDLHAPLRAMDGFSRILLEEHAPQLADEAQRYLRLVRQNAQQMGQLIGDLLTFSRLSRRPLTKQPVAPAEIVRQVWEELRAEREGRQVEFALGELPQCLADPALLKQVYANLLANALKFTRQRAVAKIEVGCREEAGQEVYFVRDNGVGFDMQYAQKLFGVFQRLHRAEDYEGTGVGLALVQRIIHRHGGRAWASAEVDKGAEFCFTLGGGAGQ